MKVANVIGARPQFIKYFPVSRSLASVGVTDILVHTGQHYDYAMSKVFFDEFGIKEPDYHLGVGSGPHGEQTAKILKEVETVFMKETPDAAVVYGDTNSTLGAALASAKLHIPVVHVESGLRSYNKAMPEEINRVLTDHISTLLLCPGKTAVENLRAEGFQSRLLGGALVPEDYFLRETVEADGDNPLIINTGDVMYDVLLYASSIAQEKSGILERLGQTDGEYCLCTIHRAENTDDPDRFGEIIGFVNDASGGRKVFLPMHPRTKKVYSSGGKKFADNVRIIDPVGYFDVLMLLKNASLLMTDSGGMQKEAYWLKVPCITLREETEWVETVESGWNVLYKKYKGGHAPIDAPYHYGDGLAAKRIAGSITAAFGKND